MSHKFYRAKSVEDSVRIQKTAAQHDDKIEAFTSNDAKLAVALNLNQCTLSRHEIEKYIWPDPLPDDVAASGTEGKNKISGDLYTLGGPVQR